MQILLTKLNFAPNEFENFGLQRDLLYEWDRKVLLFSIELRHLYVETNSGM